MVKIRIKKTLHSTYFMNNGHRDYSASIVAKDTFIQLEDFLKVQESILEKNKEIDANALRKFNGNE